MNETSVKTTVSRNTVSVITLRVLALLVLIAVFASTPVFAWFYYGRKAGAIVAITDPTALYINAANKEDIRYLNMSGLDLEAGEYKDFVFCVRGNNIDAYMLQLAYTTNNQFTFELFRATMTTDEPPANDGVVDFTTHPLSGAGVLQHYYIPQGASALSGRFLNKKSNEYAYTVGDTASTGSKNYHPDTYGDGETVYNLVHAQAEPLYWQTSSVVPVEIADKDGMGNFCHYYIIRVRWADNAKNTKETDIIYISARNTTSAVVGP